MTDFTGNKFPALTTLFASNNKFSTLANNSFNRNIEEIYIEGNTFKNIGEFLLYPKLERFSIESNDIESLVNTNIPSLQYVSFAFNDIIEFSGNEFQNLVYLDLRRNGMVKFANNKLSKLIRLRLDYNDLKEFEAQPTYLDTIQIVNLNFNLISKFSGYVSNTLTELSISNNELTQFSNNTFKNLNILQLNDNPDLNALFAQNNTFGSLTQLELKNTGLFAFQ